MKITKKGEYAMRALVDLALNYKKGMRQIQDIVREEAIPEKFLEQILVTLKNAGFIQSKGDIDALEMNLVKFTDRKDDHCSICGEKPTIKELIDYEQFCGLKHLSMSP
jgi:arginyl-tRNA synthetase